ncbi:hypothetical protein SBF1_1880006 [Candidatus Desulfosporosinus infrequens]|uniref:Uncharacterized protein n=1 Tax=Candidatus Desulfosporosinus infrequens TaxID=2043169 RepID=A0A2U3KE59_9FIRM|nr:hypothetical protein SBF1_1880006 [Candidatus Desulfosporosinus infrequens]
MSLARSQNTAEVACAKNVFEEHDAVSEMELCSAKVQIEDLKGVIR